MDQLTKTVAYIRVSTDKQAERGVSLDEQRAKVKAYAELFDLELVAIEVDAGVSAKSLNRPALERALAALETGKATALLVVKLDRLTRSVRDLGALVDKYFSTDKYTLLSVGEHIDTRTAAGRLVLNVLASVSQWEREATGERTSVALRHKARNHEFIGGHAPFGYRLTEDGKRLRRHTQEMVIVDRACMLRASGLSLRAVGRELTVQKLLPRGGGTWSPETIRRITSGTPCRPSAERAAV